MINLKSTVCIEYFVTHSSKWTFLAPYSVMCVHLKIVPNLGTNSKKKLLYAVLRNKTEPKSEISKILDQNGNYTWTREKIPSNLEEPL
jgi:hypothetical protein